MLINDWRVSTKRMTFWVRTDGLRIMDSAPIAKKFIGQRFENLICWLERQEGLEISWMPKVKK